MQQQLKARQEEKLKTTNPQNSEHVIWYLNTNLIALLYLAKSEEADHGFRHLLNP